MTDPAKSENGQRRSIATADNVGCARALGVRALAMWMVDACQMAPGGFDHLGLGGRVELEER